MESKLYNLSNPQKSIWLTEQYYSDTAVNTICGYVFIPDVVHFDILKNAINEVVRTNDSMRLKLKEEKNSCVQYLAEYKAFDIDAIELSSEKEIEEKALEMANIPFIAESEFLFHFLLFKLPNGSGGFILNIHHLISDSWTLGLIAKEVTRIYSELLLGTYKNQTFPSYLNYIEYENNYKNSDKYLKDKAYWEEVFQTVPEIASLVSSKSKQQKEISCVGKREKFILPKKDLNEIKAFCDKHKISVYNFFMAVYSLYVARVSNLDDFVMGTPILNRTNFEQKHTMGMFISIAPLRINLNRELPFSYFAKKIAFDTMSIFRHQKYSYQSILEDLRKRDPFIPNLYNVILSYQITKAVEESNQIHYSTDWVFNGNCADELQIHLFDLNDEATMTVAYDYKAEQFNAQEIAHLHARILTIIHQIIVNNDILLKEIEIVTPEEKHQILYDFNNTKVDYPRDKTIVDLFEDQVTKTPDNIAVVFEGQTLTYEELNKKANQLARFLVSSGVKVGDIVGIYLNKSLEVIISMFAILKAGAAFLPLDTDYPEDRLNYVIHHSAPKVVLSSKNIASNIKAPTILVDLTESIYQENNTTNLNVSLSPEDLMYVIYTSGSTGNPKGVMVKHKNIIRLAAFPNFIQFSQNEVMVQTGTIVFDACIFEIFGSLLHGFKLHVMKKENLLNIHYFADFLVKEKVSILFLTTGLFNQLGLQNPSMFRNLKYLLTGGDVISKTSIQKIMSCCSNIKIINCYGPTENGSYSTCYHVTGKEEIIPIGKPITNSTAYVMCDNTLCPIGVPGELWVGGDGVARGYLNNSDLTKEQFIKNPFGEGLIYKTGDLVKWLHDGNIEFIGRIDNQVKVRGFRIELSEIDRKILSQASNIKQALTMVQNINNTKTICSYIVSDDQIDIAELKNTLKKYLPAYMLPTFIMQLKEFPLNINGKIDRKAFPIPNITKAKKDIVPARNELDKEIIRVLSEVLNITNVSISDSFFDLGGDSLSAITFTNVLTQDLNVMITVQDIFHYPVIEHLSDYIASLAKTQKDTIKAAPKMDYYPVSFAQRRIYYASSIDSGSVLYNTAGGIIIDKVLDIALLEQCFQVLINRHEALRTHFQVVEDDIVQIVEDKIDFTLSSEMAVSDDLNTIYSNFVKPFDLSKAPLFRAKVITLKNHRMLLLLDMHHIISDGTSLSILLQELCDLYNGKVLSEKQVDYKDFTLWEKEQSEKEEWKQSKEFWVNQYQDEIPLLNMPTTFPRPSVQSFEGANYHTKLSKEVFEKVNETAKNLGITPYMLMLSAYYILLFKYTSQDDIVVGTPIVGRQLPELSNMLGMFVNTLALRNKVEHSVSFHDFANSIKDYCLSAFQHQNYPFDELVKDLNVKRDTSRNPLFDVMFIYQNNGYPTINFEGANAEYFIPDSQVAKFDLSLEVIPMGNEFSLRFEYCTKLFDEDFIERLSSHYINILNAILENTEIKIADIDMLSKEERDQILYDFNNTAVDYPRDKTIVDLFEEQVGKTPDNIAVVFEDQKLTYRELNEKANQLARFLVSAGVSNNSIVGIMLPRSLEMMISILAVLKSGAAYLPIDPDYPSDRIEYILNDSNAKLLISFSDISKALSCNTTMINLDTLCSELANLSDKNLSLSINHEDLAYIIYTSGSTGKPKGVKLKHLSLSNLTNYCNHYVEYLKDNQYRAVVSVTTVSFDIFIFETLISLQKGLKLVIANGKEQNIPTCLDELIKNEKIEIIQTTPSRMQLFYSNISSMPHFSQLKFITLAGEQLPISLVKNLKLSANCKVYNGYGPSETTVFSTLTDVTHKESMTIGKPLFNTQIYILSRDNQLCPIGIPGEICISGDGVGYGYINRDELTQKSFVPNPFIPSSIMYKTGDLGYYDANGEIVCLGRLDNQIKIRGLRIELEEIEKTLLAIPHITHCAVIKSVDENAHEFLCAYFVKNGPTDISHVRNVLYKKLPNYMVPQYFIELEELPYTPNGKIDKKMLPAPKIEVNKKVVAARNKIDTVLIDIFKDLLKLETVSIEDSLYDLGGDSLTSINIATSIYNQLGLAITIKDIFEHPTVKDLSDYLATLSSKNVENEIKKAEKREFYPTSSAQKRIYYASSMDHNSVLYNIAGGIIIDKVLDIALLEQCFQVLINRHEALRTHFQVVEDDIVQIVEDKIDFTLSSEMAVSDDLNTIYSNFVKPFDLSKAPLFRAKVITLKNHRMLLLLDMHHIISDGTSLSILLQELCDLYNGKVLSEKQVDYKDFTLWEKEQSEKEEWKQSKEFWVNQYQDEIPLLNMPTTFPRPSVQSFEGANYHTKLSKEVFEKVNETAKNLGITPYMLMLSAYYILLFKYTSQDDIVVGTPIVGRQLPELSNMLGMFVNTLALRNKVEHSVSFHDFANSIKDYCLSAFQHQNYPFDELVKDLNVKRDTSRNPLFDVMFIYQNNGYPTINFEGANAEYFIPDSQVAKFDLSLEVIPMGNEFSLRFEYCTKLFDEDFIERLSSHYINILNAILENTEIKIADIDMLSKEERDQILYDFNNTAVDYPRDKTIVDLFEEQVGKTPDNIAVVFEDQKLTYRELNEKANQLARFLVSAGVSNNSIVGIMLPRSLEMIISMFGILKAKAAYLPLDPTYPKNRIKYILEDSNVTLLLTKDSSISLNNVKTINVSLTTSNIYDTYENSNLNADILPTNLAYVIYTSGSTGNPKGVAITHRNVNNFIQGTTSRIKFDKVIVSVTTICFDIFVLESILPLQNGLTVVIANEEQQTIPELLNELCIKNNVAMIQTTPSKFSLLISDETSLDFLKNIKTIMLGGEPFPYNLLLKIKSLTKCKIYNMYGPTETTVWSSIQDLTNTNNITIGTPIANTFMYILDNNLNLLPTNVPGKLYIGGDGVSDGYLHKQELTDSKFVMNPYNKLVKIYDTGDLAKWSENGELIYLGRCDFQVKIRGLRIELGEIEKVILTFKGIEKTIVTASSDSLNRQILCAYFVSKNRISISELKQYLSIFLPNYMIPTYMMQLEDFQYTPNGKIDKKSLPTPSLVIDKKDILLPSTNTEHKLAKIWEDLLCISPISIDDNFFEIGGDSLLALKMQMQLLKENINITYSEIFKYNTINKLAMLIDKNSENIDANVDLYANYDYSNINMVLNNNHTNILSNISYTPIENILLTGVTGFLGAHILAYLIEHTNIEIYCLVRKDPSVSLIDKVLNKLHFYFGNRYDSFINKRIFIINSDLTKNNLGLTDEKMLSISNKISYVINSAAIVKHYGDYKDFEAINVTAVKKLIDFCKKYHKKLIQISTISVSGNTLSDFAVNTNAFKSDVEFDEANLYIGQSMENVYVRSKFEAEKLILEEISTNNLNALILRIGNITNRATDGKFQFNSNENAFANKIKAFLEIAALPDYVLDKYIEFSPVDYVAEAVVKSIEYSNNNLSVLHIYNENHVYLNNFINLLPEKYKISIVSDADFQDIINNMLKNDDKKYIISYILNDLNDKNKLIYDTHIKIKNDFSQDFFRQAGFSWPIIDKKYIKNLLDNI